MARTATTAQAQVKVTERTATNSGAALTVGWSGSKRQVSAVRDYLATAPHAVKFRQFAQVEGAWVETCGRCGGDGNVGYGPFAGVCYGCNGSGLRGEARTTEAMATRMKSWARGVKRTSDKQAAKIEARMAEHTAWQQANPEIVAWAMALAATGREEIHSHATSVEHREEALLWEGPLTEVKISDERILDDGAAYWVSVTAYEETFGLGGKADGMVAKLRGGYSLERNEEGYIAKVMASQQERAAGVNAGRWVGEVTQRVEITGTVKFIADASNHYGPRLRVVVEGTGQHEGARWTTWTTANAAYDLVEGQAVRVKGTVSKNEDYQGRKQQVVKRAAFTA